MPFHPDSLDQQPSLPWAGRTLILALASHPRLQATAAFVSPGAPARQGQERSTQGTLGSLQGLGRLAHQGTEGSRVSPALATSQTFLLAQGLSRLVGRKLRLLSPSAQDRTGGGQSGGRAEREAGGVQPPRSGDFLCIVSWTLETRGHVLTRLRAGPGAGGAFTWTLNPRRPCDLPSLLSSQLRTQKLLCMKEPLAGPHVPASCRSLRLPPQPGNLCGLRADGQMCRKSLWEALGLHLLAESARAPERRTKPS